MRVQRIAVVLSLVLGGVTAGATGTGGTVEAAITAPRQLMLLMDGSGSISSADWQLQIDGIAAALSDRTAFPRDGSIAVGIVQWSNGTTRVEVPLTVIDNTSDDTVIDTLRAISQIGGGTNPGDGIRAGTDALIADGDDASEWLLCMSTDGSRNQGESMSTATSYAIASGVDRYSVVAIEDGGFDRAAAIAAYSPFVFGDGTVTVARNAAEFATLLTGSCLNPPLELVGLEVNQAVQSWDMSVPIVRDKLGVVRAFVQTTDGSTVRTSGLLFGEHNGQPLPGSPLAPINTGGTVTAAGDVAMRRADRDASLNFAIPRSWTAGGATFRLELPGGAQCNEAAPPANTCSVDIVPQGTDRLELRTVSITYDDGGTTFTPTDAELGEQGLRVWTQFPVPSLTNDKGVLGDTFSSKPELSDVNVRLATMRDDECVLGACNEDAYWYGVLAGGGGGLADGIPGRVSSGYLSGTGARDDEGYARNRGPHEVAHTLGLPHAVDGDLGLINTFLWIFGGQKQGYCGEVASKSSEDFPTISDIGGSNYPTLGPLGDDDTEVWGFDWRFRSSVEDLAVVDPYADLPLMSYGNGSQCNLTSDGQLRWISGHGYESLVGALGGRAGGGGGGGGGGSWDALFVTGLIDFESETATFAPARVLPSDDVEYPTEGEYQLDIVGTDGSVIATTPFDPIELDADSPAEGLVKARFNVPVPLPAVPIGAARVSYDGEVLGQMDASAAAPTVAIVSPSAGDVLADDDVTISWTGSDADSSTIWYSVFYSPDGTTWRALATSTTAMELTVDRDQLAASGTGRLIVIASDGLNSSRAESDLFMVANNAPTVDLLSPTAGGAPFSGVQTVLLSALAYDREDAALTGAALQWSSDLDGPLGSGEEIALQAYSLTEGTHVVTVTATDSAGLTATATVEIEIVRILSPDVDSLRDRLIDVAAALAASTDRRFLDAADDVTLATTAEWWTDEDHVAPATGEEGFKALRAALFDLRHLDSAETEDDALADEIVDVARALALDAFATADLSLQTFAKAERELRVAEEAAAAGIAEKAVDEFRKAWKTSTG